jgi:D-alanyl-D-alanine-carboxypeptidase/D-alanyl-D-alanine-endopeptidase
MAPGQADNTRGAATCDINRSPENRKKAPGAEGEEIDMTQTVTKRMMLALAAALMATTIVAPAAAQEAAGNWLGVLDVSGTRLPLVLHLKRDEAGALGGTMDSPAQGATGIPLAEVKVEAGSLTFAVPSITGTYKGQWDADAKLWKGEWSQAGQRWPLAFAVPPAPQPLPADWQLPPDADMARLIADRNAGRPGQGIVVGMLDASGPRFVAGGTGPAARVDRNTLFEIGSISKLFTALILADMVNKGEVSLDDPAAKYLPAGHHMPARNGRQITLRDLATHRSGLPRMPDDMGRADTIEDPFAGYGEDKLLAFLDRYQLTRDVGSQWEYSNLGVGLLGYLLGRAAHSDYETLLRTRITGPLGMKDTMVTLQGGTVARLVAPFDRYMRPAKPWNMTVFAPAGGIRSSAADMLVFAHAVLDPKSPIAAAMKTALAARGPGQTAQVEQALGWLIAHPRPDIELLLHDGETGGYQSILVLEPAKARAVVALANSQAQPAPTDLALHAILGTPVGPTPPLAAPPPPPTKHTEITLPAADLDKIVGRYNLGPGFNITVSRKDGTLYVLREEAPGAQPLPVYPEAPLLFFWKALDATIRFSADASGAVTGAEIKQGPATFTGKRIAQ